MRLPPRREPQETDIDTIRPRPVSSQGVAYLLLYFFILHIPMKKTSILFLLALIAFNGIIAQPPADFSKMSRHLVSLLSQHQTDRIHQSPTPYHTSVCVLMTLTNGLIPRRIWTIPTTSMAMGRLMSIKACSTSSTCPTPYLNCRSNNLLRRVSLFRTAG